MALYLVKSFWHCCNTVTKYFFLLQLTLAILFIYDDDLLLVKSQNLTTENIDPSFIAEDHFDDGSYHFDDVLDIILSGMNSTYAEEFRKFFFKFVGDNVTINEVPKNFTNLMGTFSNSGFSEDGPEKEEDVRQVDRELYTNRTIHGYTETYTQIPNIYNRTIYESSTNVYKNVSTTINNLNYEIKYTAFNQSREDNWQNANNSSFNALRKNVTCNSTFCEEIIFLNTTYNKEFNQDEQKTNNESGIHLFEFGYTTKEPEIISRFNQSVIKDSTMAVPIISISDIGLNSSSALNNSEHNGNYNGLFTTTPMLTGFPNSTFDDTFLAINNYNKRRNNVTSETSLNGGYNQEGQNSYNDSHVNIYAIPVDRYNQSNSRQLTTPIPRKQFDDRLIIPVYRNINYTSRGRNRTYLTELDHNDSLIIPIYPHAQMTTTITYIQRIFSKKRKTTLQPTTGIYTGDDQEFADYDRLSNIHRKSDSSKAICSYSIFNRYSLIVFVLYHILTALLG